MIPLSEILIAGLHPEHLLKRCLMIGAALSVEPARMFLKKNKKKSGRALNVRPNNVTLLFICFLNYINYCFTCLDFYSPDQAACSAFFDR
jgi:hypothetical protein